MARRFHLYRFFYEGPDFQWTLGVMLVEIGKAEQDFADLAFRRDFDQLRQLDPDADVQYLVALEADIRRMLASRTAETIDSDKPISRHDWIISQIENNFSNLITVSDPVVIETDSPGSDLQLLLANQGSQNTR